MSISPGPWRPPTRGARSAAAPSAAAPSAAAPSAAARSATARCAALVALLCAAALLLSSSPARAATGDVGDIGIAGPTYSGVTHPPTSDKPQSKLWWDDGSWWATLWVTGSGWHIERLDRANETWVDTGVLIDPRPTSLTDALWDGHHLFVADEVSTVSTQEDPNPSDSGQPALLYRYSYSGGAYVLDSGFPTTINDVSSETLTIDEDSTGALWSTWVQDAGTTASTAKATVYVNSSTTGGASWGTPFVLPVTDPHPSVDDISAVVAFGGHGAPEGASVGVMWSDQLTGRMLWAVHADGDPATTWTSQTAFDGTDAADDHINLKTLQGDPEGRVFAVVKTSADLAAGSSTAPQLELLVDTPVPAGTGTQGTGSQGTGTFTATPISTVADCQTRPQVVLDATNDVIHVFTTGPVPSTSGCPHAGTPGAVYEKTSPLDHPSFASGRGTVVLQDASSPEMNNVTTSKQSATSASGIVVLASDDTEHQYWFADEAVPSPPLPDRLAGTDRYQTAVAISRAGFPAGASTAVVASGVAFPDALSAAPLAHALHAPVLLVEPDAVPAEVSSELARLGATRVVIVGGPTAVSDGVATALGSQVATVQRVYGDDRYATAADVAGDVATATGAHPAVYLASGEAFPDALGGSALAAATNGVVLLTRQGSLPAVTSAELTALHPPATTVLGGTSAVSAAVQSQAAAVTTETVGRLQGGDRYGTASAVAERFGSADVALVASGTTFPDALAGAALGLPVVLSQPGCRSAEATSALSALGAVHVVALGGTTALSEVARTGSAPCAAAAAQGDGGRR